MVTTTLMLRDQPVDPAVVLAPMAGITNVAFRRLCREFAGGSGIFVCEMITTRALVERNPKTMRMITFGADERPRSLQLYGVDPATVRKAVEMVAAEDLADHIDLNFGCSVPKVTRKGGGAALPWKRRLFSSVVRAAVEAAAPAGIPVTVKMRKGIDDDHLTYLDAGLLAQDAGVSWVALHGRTAAQRYSGTADWEAIARLKSTLDIPVLGNGDVWEAEDARRMMRETGCDGVVIGRGCLGRPWLFEELATRTDKHSEELATRTEKHSEELATRTDKHSEELATRTDKHSEELATRTDKHSEELATRTDKHSEELARGVAAPVLPSLGEVAVVMRRHAELLSAWLGSERDGVVDFRKHVAWYLKGFPVGSRARRSMAMASSLSELDDLLGELDHSAPYPVSELGRPRGRTNSPAAVRLPDRWLIDRDDAAVPEGAELDYSGG